MPACSILGKLFRQHTIYTFDQFLHCILSNTYTLDTVSEYDILAESPVSYESSLTKFSTLDIAVMSERTAGSVIETNNTF